MDFDSTDKIRQSGFKGFPPVSTLRESDCDEVPDTAGVYLVLRPKITRQRFLRDSTGGHFKGRNPTVPVGYLKAKWVEHASVLYIGSAEGSKTGTLRCRVNKFMKFGQHRAVGHWGGRYIWQLCDASRLLLCWKSTAPAEARNMESSLIRGFEAVYGKLPFANLRH